MFKNFLSTTPPVPATRILSIPSPSSPSNSTSNSTSPSPSPKPTKMSPEQALEDGQAASPAQIHLTKRKKYANVDSDDGDDDVPGLILPPSFPSEIAMDSTVTKDENSSSAKNHFTHTRDDSFETTSSQSMDLSSFIKSLELQQEEKQKQQLAHNHTKEEPGRSSGGDNSPHSWSLSLAASQVDISLTNDTEDIQVDSDSDKADNKILSNNNGKSNNKKSTTNKPVVLKELTEVLMINDSSSPPDSYSPTAKNYHHTMAHVGEQLLHESLVTGKEENGEKKAQIAATSDVSDQKILSKGKCTTNIMKYGIFVFGLVIAILVVISVAALFLGNGNARPTDVAETVALSIGGDGNARPNDVAEFLLVLSNGGDLMKKECQASSKSDLQVQDTTSRSNQTNFEQIPTEENINNDENDPLRHDSSNYLHEEDTNHNVDEIPNSSKIDCYWSHSWMKVVLTILAFMVLCLFSSSSFEEKSKMKSEMEAKKEAKIGANMETMVPVTPTGKSLYRRRANFLTPPLQCKNRAQEPTQWMSPCYGEDAIDVSVYKAMKAVDLRELLRKHSLDNRGTKEKMIKLLVTMHQNELACLTVQQLRPKLRKRNLSQKGTKKDVIRRLVEAGHI